MFFRDQAVKADKQKCHHKSKMAEIQENNKTGWKIWSGEIPDHKEYSAGQDTDKQGAAHIPGGRHLPGFAF